VINRQLSKISPSWRCLWAVVACFFIQGCHGTNELPLPSWSAPVATVSASHNSFEEFRNLGDDSLQSCQKYLRSVNLSQAQEIKVDRLLRPQMQKLGPILSGPCVYVYSVTEPKTTRQGLSFLGDHFGWRIEFECANQNFDAAVNDTLQATRFGQVLLGADALDAIAGDEIIDGARKALAPFINQLGASQLERLSRGLVATLGNRPGRAITITNEFAAMMQMVLEVQTDASNKQINELTNKFGPVVQPGIEALTIDGDPTSPASRRFFESLAEQAMVERNWLSTNALLPKAKRATPPVFPVNHKTPWNSFAKAILMTDRPWLKVDDESLARTRMLALYANILAQIKTTKTAPTKEPTLESGMNEDPYSGLPFFYVPKGNQFLLYSAGENGLDDGGETDSSFTSPDLFVEDTTQ